MTAAVFQDLRKGIISNVLILFGFLGGAVFQLIRLGGSGLILFFGSAVFPVLLFSILYYFRMIGAGDIKLLAALGGFLGISDLFRCLVCIWPVMCLLISREKNGSPTAEKGKKTGSFRSLYQSL